MKIIKTGKVTITDKGTIIEEFSFGGKGHLLTAQVSALKWAKKEINKCIKESKAQVRACASKK